MKGKWHAAGAVGNRLDPGKPDGIDDERPDSGIIHVPVSKLARGVHAPGQQPPEEQPESKWEGRLLLTETAGIIVRSNAVPIRAQQIASSNYQHVRLTAAGG